MEESRRQLQMSHQEHEEAVRRSRKKLEDLERVQAEREQKKEEADLAVQVLRGKIEAEHEQLLKTNQEYREIYESQMHHSAEDALQGKEAL